MNNYANFSDVDNNMMWDETTENNIIIALKGCEDRSYAVLKKYFEQINPQKVLLLDSRLKNEKMSQEEILKYNEIDSIMGDNISKIKTISIENSNIGSYLISENFSENEIIYVDISSMNFWEISDILFFLLKIVSVKKVRILYTEPGLYHYENDDISHYEHEIFQVSTNYPRNYFSTKTTEEEILVSMIGFEKNVNKMMKDNFEVSEYYSINGFPSFYPKAKDISQANNFDFLGEIEPSNRYSAEAVNPFITFNTLLDINKASKGAFMNICPLSTKPMSVGACLYALKYPTKTRIVYPYEESVTTKSDGIGKTYCYTIENSFISSLQT